MELHLKLQIILEIYAILCLAGLPIVLCVAVYLYRKTDVIARIDEWLDGILGPPKHASRNTSKGRPEREGQSDNETSSATVTERQRTLPRFVLPSGETYRCCRTKDSFTSRIDSMWESGYPFVGDIGEEDGVFTAMHTGICTIFFDGMAKFEIEVLPRISGWVSDRDIDDIVRSSPISDVKSRLLGTKLLQTDAGGRPLVYSEPCKGVKTATYGQDEGNVVKVLYEVHDGDGIEGMMDERFTRIPTIGDIEIWYRLDCEGFADVVAFLRRTEHRTLLGISKAWRAEMEQAEVKSNLQMVERCFADLTDMEPASVSLKDDEKQKLHEGEDRVTEISTDSMAEETGSEEDGEMAAPEESGIHEMDEAAAGQFDPEPDGEIDVPEEPDAEGGEDAPDEDYPDIDAFQTAEEEEESIPTEKRDTEFYDSSEDRPGDIEIPEFDF